MTRKRILNFTSTKKVDHVAPNVAYPASFDDNAIRGAEIPSNGSPHMFIWCPTARGLRQIFENDRVEVPAGRSKSTCWIKGIKEKITIATLSGVPWRWRRIVFSHKGELSIGPEFEGDITTSVVTTADGREIYYRNTHELDQDNRIPFGDYLFVGQGQGPGADGGRIDWTDYMTAPADNRRFNIMYDKVVTVQSGNDSGVLRNYNRWHPVEKNLVYGDEEIGGQVLTSYKSTNSKPGIGDVYIVDIFTSVGVDSSNVLLFTPNSAVYWHEK